MKVLVDTSVWSLAFRRNPSVNLQDAASVEVLALSKLIDESNAAIVGTIWQELLSGISDSVQFSKLKALIAAFSDEPLSALDYEFAAACFNECRATGAQGRHTDFLICAVALRQNQPIFTIDKDFLHFAKIIAIRLFLP